MDQEEAKRMGRDFLEKCTQIILQPGEFFSRVDEDEPWKQVIIFNVLCGLIAGIVYTILTLGSGFLMILGYPMAFIIYTMVGGSVLFLSFKLFGGQGTWNPTVKMVGYTQAINIIALGIPVIGILAGFYQIWLFTAVGQAAHELDTRRAFIAVIVLIILIIVLSFLITTILGVTLLGGLLSREGQL